MPDSYDALEKITQDSNKAMEFIVNIRHMQSVMSQMVFHQGLEERKKFLRHLKMNKVTASAISHFTTLAALIDVISMLNSEFTALLSINA